MFGVLVGILISVLIGLAIGKIITRNWEKQLFEEMEKKQKT